MTHFIPNIRHDRHFAASEIIEFDKGNKYANSNGLYYEATLRNGAKTLIDSHDINNMLNPAIAVVPATDGYNVIHAGFCLSGEEYLYRVPVIAWRHMADGGVRPVTVRGENDCELNDVPIETPTGEIYNEGAIYSSAESFLADLREFHAGKFELRAAITERRQPEEQA